MSAIVGALADKVAETSTIAKKQKTGHVYPVISILYSKLLEIRLAIGAKRTGAGDSILKEVEVEVRVGMITEGLGEGTTEEKVHIQKDIELEFELLEDIKQQWLREIVDEKATAMSKFIAEQLLQLIDF
eukprot:gene20025-20555_t